MECCDALLDPGATGILDTDDRGAVVHREIHHLADLVGNGRSETAAVRGEVLCVDEDRSSIDLAVAGDDSVTIRAVVLNTETGGMVSSEHVEFLERVLVEEQFDPFPSTELAEVMLAIDRALIRRSDGFFAQGSQLLDAVFSAHGSPVSLRF